MKDRPSLIALHDYMTNIVVGSENEFEPDKLSMVELAHLAMKQGISVRQFKEWCEYTERILFILKESASIMLLKTNGQTQIPKLIQNIGGKNQ